jgi:hypothetical protein
VELNKPWPFWGKKGGKALDLAGGVRVDVFWDLRSAKFAASSSSPEPAAGFYVALACNREVVLLLGDGNKRARSRPSLEGDGKKDAYKRTRSRPSLEDAVLVCRRETVLGCRTFGARARLDARRSKEHEIGVDIALLAVNFLHRRCGSCSLTSRTCSGSSGEMRRCSSTRRRCR